MNTGLKDTILALCNNQRFTEAEAAVHQAYQAAETVEERVELLLILSDVYDRAGDFDEACKALFALIEIDAGSVRAWNNLGVLCRRADKADAAREAFLHAASLDPDNADVLVNLGSVSLKLNDPLNAKLHLEHALGLAPQHALAHANLALVLATFGRIEEAEEALRLAVMHGYDNPDPIMGALQRLKDIRQQMQQKKEAEGEAAAAAE